VCDPHPVLADNGTAACAPLAFVNNSMGSYTAAGIPFGKAAPIWPCAR
jgi:hypothetical protein